MSVDAPALPIVAEDDPLPVADLDHAIRDVLDTRRARLTRQRDILKAFQRRIGLPESRATSLLDQLAVDTVNSLYGGR
jgi:hypothetical protein